ncbi:MAG: cation:proton antiporter subunit C [Thermotogae bacterium]|nr:cation:proton antiporter subunit C [Thermotogota bacterium]
MLLSSKETQGGCELPVGVLILLVVGIGLLGLLLKRNLILKIISMDIMATGVVSYFVYVSSKTGKHPPIMMPNISDYVDPVPQAVILTAIVIGFAVLSILLVYVMMLAKYFPTLDVRRIERKWKK